MPLDMPVEYLRQGRRRVRRRFCRFRCGCARGDIRKAERRGLGVGKRVQEISQRFGLAQQAFGQPGGERPFDAQEQLGPRQAVEAPVLVEGTVEPGAFHRPAPRLDLASEFAGDPQHRRFENIDRGRRGDRGHGRGFGGVRHRPLGCLLSAGCRCVHWPGAGPGRRPGTR